MQNEDTTGIIVAVYVGLKMVVTGLGLAFYSKWNKNGPPDGVKPKGRKWANTLAWIGVILLWLMAIWVAYELRK